MRVKRIFENIISNVGEVYHCKKTVELEQDITSVLDIQCSLQSFVTKFEDCNMVVSGTLLAGMIVCGEDGAFVYCEKPVDFEYKYPVNCENGVPHCEPQLEILSCGYTILSPDSVEIQAELGINADVYERRDMSLIKELTLDDTKTSERKSDAALTIYFTAENERVWDIARNYNASIEEIMSINDLDADTLPEGRMILVPMT